MLIFTEGVNNPIRLFCKKILSVEKLLLLKKSVGLTPFIMQSLMAQNALIEH